MLLKLPLSLQQNQKLNYFWFDFKNSRLNRILKTYLLFSVLFLWGNVTCLFAQEQITDSTHIINEQIELEDSLAASIDLQADTLLNEIPPDSVPLQKDIIEFPIDYSSFDSLSFAFEDSGQVAYLYGEAGITYGDIQLDAGLIRIDFNTKEIYAEGIPDSLNKIIQKPHFKQGEEEFDCSSLRYNFDTGKGFVENVITQQQDGIIHGERAKMLSKDVYCMQNGKFTECDAEHPHYYLKMVKGKVINNKAIITGRSYMVLEEFPIYFPFLPFAYLPTQNTTYSSGVIIPSYGELPTYGFYLKDGGFYWAASDYFDFTVKGDIYSKGSWALRLGTNYKKRYKFNGNIGFTISRHFTGEPGIDQSISKNFAINWSHRQDSKANPTSNLSASVNFSTSGNERLNEYDNGDAVLKNTKSSRVTYSKNFQNLPFSLSLSANASQNSRDSTVSLTLPQANFNMKMIYPFKGLSKPGKTAFYEDIGFKYSSSISHSIRNIKEYDLFSTPLREWNRKISHNTALNLPTIKLFSNITISPSISYDEKWGLEYVEKYWLDGYYTSDNETFEKKWVPGRVVEETKQGFKRNYEYSYSVSASTNIYGKFYFLNPDWKIKALRHKISPSVSFSYHPDFSEERFGFYDWVQTDSLGTMEQYNFMENNSDYTRGGKSGSIGFRLRNNLEMKVADYSDTTKVDATKKVPIIDDLGFSGSYNMMADSMKLSNIRWNVRTKIAGFNLNVNGTLSPYALDERGRVTGTYMWTEAKGFSRVGRITRASTGFSYTFTSQKLKKTLEARAKKRREALRADGYEVVEPSERESGSSGYADFDAPWRLGFSYTVSYSKTGLTPKITQGLNFNGGIDLGKWKSTFSSNFNFDTMKLGYTRMSVSRSLHCWKMAFSFAPFGNTKFYSFKLSANSQMLQDLKIDRTNRDLKF